MSEDSITAHAEKIGREITGLNAHLERLDREIQLAMAHRATFERLNEHAKSFPRSRAAHAFNLTVEAHLYLTALALGRLWDRAPDSLAVPAMATRLGRRWVLRSIVDNRLDTQRRRASHSDVRYSDDFPQDVLARFEGKRVLRLLEDADGYVTAALTTRDEIVSECVSISDSDEVSRMNEMRNRFLAHAAEISRSGRAALKAGQEVRTPYISELMALCDRTARVIERMRLLVQETGVSYRDHMREFGVNVSQWISRGF